MKVSTHIWPVSNPSRDKELRMIWICDENTNILTVPPTHTQKKMNRSLYTGNEKEYPITVNRSEVRQQRGGGGSGGTDGSSDGVYCNTTTTTTC
ncbi:hypothetical protein E2C01_090843 [Portunus trituberculatus]|uniref:Uncharacterized protein n=1 Tax=Portunus trituberculatus TaxID=210409 RepID=A0A5B7JTH7_PORTR|nr:hypothetical protein [Portunus trituberculatus]